MKSNWKWALAVPFVCCISAAAQECDSVLVDAAGVVSDRASEVKASASRLVNVGADVRVRTMTDMQAPTLDDWERDMERSCKSWQSPDGGRKNNLIVIAVAVKNHKCGMWYGSQWETAIGSEWPRIEAQFMNPRFRARDFAGGLIGGIAALTQLVSASLTPPLQTAAPSSLPPVQAGDQGSSGYGVLLFLSFGGLLIAVVVLLIWRRINAGARLGARRSALMAKQHAALGVTQISDRLDTLRSLGPKNDPTLRESKQLVEQASQAFVQLVDSGVADPDRKDLSIADYESIEKEYRSIQKLIDSANRAMEEHCGAPILSPVKDSSPILVGTTPSVPAITPVSSVAPSNSGGGITPLEAGLLGYVVGSELNGNENSRVVVEESWSSRSTDEDSSSSSSFGGSTDYGIGAGSDGGGVTPDRSGGGSSGGGSSDW